MRSVYSFSESNIVNGICYTISFGEDEKRGYIEIKHQYKAVYGLGERFNSVNQRGSDVTIQVEEKFCNQGSISYCPIPFFFTDNGLGVFIDTATVTSFSFMDTVKIIVNKDTFGRLPHINVFTGTTSEIMHEYLELTGLPKLPPKWSFGPWMSANRWNTQQEAERQAENTVEYRLPHTVMVIEAWSDEATFYRFNEHGEWDNPEQMIKQLNAMGIRLVLWQIPVIKRMDKDAAHEVLDADRAYAIEHSLCIKNKDGSPYRIPEDHWFAGSLLPDFTNKETVRWWFEKRKYLLDIGVAGFKTDGGEFVLTDDVQAADGSTGLEMRNRYAHDYVEAYIEFIGDERVLFSRAGYIGQQRCPMQWAGDQMSTWSEFRSVIKAGLSIGLSGVPFWGFDIAGFAGSMPSLQLYERSMQTAVFTPVMQWHSEPVGGQFSELLSATEGINDRSPWNISRLYNDSGLIERLRYHFNLRMNLLPYIYDQARRASETGLPVMKHLIIEYPEDETVKNIDDCFMLGDIYVAPIFEENCYQRRVYLPEGSWTDLFELDNMEADNETSKRIYEGNKWYTIECSSERTPAFIRLGGCIVLNLDSTLSLGSDVGNKTEQYNCLCFFVTGESGKYSFIDDLENDVEITWNKDNVSYTRNKGNVEFTVLRLPERVDTDR